MSRPVPSVNDPVVAPDALRAALIDLRAWSLAHCQDEDPVVRAIVLQACTAIAHRLMKFPILDELDRLTARQLVLVAGMLPGALVLPILRRACTVAIIEDDAQVVNRLLATPFLPEQSLWLATLIGASSDPARAAQAMSWIEAMPPHELGIATLLVARAQPASVDCAILDRLAAAGEDVRLIAALCLALCADRAHEPVVRRYLHAHPEVRYAHPRLP